MERSWCAAVTTRPRAQNSFRSHHWNERGAPIQMNHKTRKSLRKILFKKKKTKRQKSRDQNLWTCVHGPMNERWPVSLKTKVKAEPIVRLSSVICIRRCRLTSRHNARIENNQKLYEKPDDDDDDDDKDLALTLSFLFNPHAQLDINSCLFPFWIFIYWRRIYFSNGPPPLLPLGFGRSKSIMARHDNR